MDLCRNTERFPRSSGIELRHIYRCYANVSGATLPRVTGIVAATRGDPRLAGPTEWPLTPILDRMSQPKCNIFYAPATSGKSLWPNLKECLKQNETLTCCGRFRVAAHTHFGKDVSSQMLHLYIAGASESPLTPIFKRMYHAKCEFENVRM